MATSGTRALRLASQPAWSGDAPLENEVAYKVADQAWERAEAFRLVYRAYVEAGLMRPHPAEMRVMPHHLLPTTATFVALRGSRVVATVSMVGDGRLGLPLECAYPQEVELLRGPGTWLGEVSALASAAEPVSSIEVVIGLMRLMAQFSRRHGVDHLLVAVHPRHGRFYRRCLGFKALGGERAYPAVDNRPAVALHLDLSRLEEDPPASYGLFFGKAIDDEQLRYCPISAAERRQLVQFLVSETDTATAESGAMLACA